MSIPTCWEDSCHGANNRAEKKRGGLFGVSGLSHLESCVCLGVINLRQQWELCRQTAGAPVFGPLWVGLRSVTKSVSG